MFKVKRHIIKFSYDIEKFITYIQENIKDKYFTEFREDRKIIRYIER